MGRIREKRGCGYHWVIPGMILLLLAFLAGPAAALTPLSISVDENGNGFYQISDGAQQTLSWSLAQDPGPGGLANALTYSLPFTVQQGDVLMHEPGQQTGVYSDVIRFNGDNTLIFYSDKDDLPLAKADIGLPGSYYSNSIVIEELGPEGNNGASYTPSYTATTYHPGYIFGYTTQYTFISDVPLPPSAWMLGSGLLGLLGFGWRRRQG